jgi:hypothetical protein
MPFLADLELAAPPAPLPQDPDERSDDDDESREGAATSR